MKKKNYDYISTGHYARHTKKRSNGAHLLKEGRDKSKDQSYFLAFISRHALIRSLFPLGDLYKKEVIEAAEDMALPASKRKSSQDFCFASGGYSRHVIEKYNDIPNGGNILDTSGEVIGKHNGIHNYTVGQRKGLGVAASQPLYVIKISKKRNEIVAGIKKEAHKKRLIVKQVSWLWEAGDIRNMAIRAKIRYQHRKAGAILEKRVKGRYRLTFKDPQFAPAPGQAAVFYKGDIVIGGGWIEKVIQ